MHSTHETQYTRRRITLKNVFEFMVPIFSSDNNMAINIKCKVYNEINQSEILFQKSSSVMKNNYLKKPYTIVYFFDCIVFFYDK